ncbi:hypothetical protein IFO70_32930 [Phormidium tenue FACHB-886]|nr:hypothetical protein [Phormidium tenue FACHB-886]
MMTMATTAGLWLWSSRVKAAEEWVEVTVNAVGDRFLVDQNSIERSENTIRYWEYRQFKQANNAFLDFEVEQPVYGVMIYRSLDCTSGVERTRRLVIFDQNRQVIQRVNYDDNGGLTQPMAGSSAAAVVRYVCTQQQTQQQTQQ